MAESSQNPAALSITFVDIGDPPPGGYYVFRRKRSVAPWELLLVTIDGEGDAIAAHPDSSTQINWPWRVFDEEGQPLDPGTISEWQISTAQIVGASA